MHLIGSLLVQGYIAFTLSLGVVTAQLAHTNVVHSSYVCTWLKAILLVFFGQNEFILETATETRLALGSEVRVYRD